MQRIEVTASGITVTSVTEPLISMHGKEMRPGTTAVHELAWDEIADISLSVIELPPGAQQWTTLVIDLTWGEYIEVAEEAQGFAEAVQELSREWCNLRRT